MKLGLCLTGGGSRGAYQIGACMALKEAGIWNRIEAFSGTSIGAVNAVMLASSEIEKVRDVWFDMPDEALSSTENFFKRLLKERSKLISNGLYTIEILEEKLKENLNIQNLRNKEVYVTLALGGEEDGGVISLLRTSYKHYIKKDRQVKYSPIWKQDEEHIYKQVLASCSIPVVFSPTNIDGKQYFDGGVYDNVPVVPLIEGGCDKIIVLHLDRLPYFYKSRHPEITFYPLKPKRSLGWMLNFSTSNAKNRYEQGYNECKEFLEENQIL